MQKLSMSSLISLEKENNLWEYKLFDYPLWIHCREPLLNTGIMVHRKINIPSIGSMLKSFFFTCKFLLFQYKYEKIFFLMDRAELLEIYQSEKNTKKILFLNTEQERVYKGKDYISSDFFNLLRFISRKIAFRVFKKQYQQIIEDLKKIHYDIGLSDYIKIAMGDALFLKFLSLIFTKKNEKIYTGSVIPMGEKFLNVLNSFEVQHGVIHQNHSGYISIPEVKNTLILYAKHYKVFLQRHGYKGKYIIQEYKKTFFEKNTERYFPIVIYTQPILEMQESINNLFQVFNPSEVFVQIHPKDYFQYTIDTQYFVSGTIPSEVGYPIMYVSSIIENFTFYNRSCYIYDLKYMDISIEDFLKIYTQESSSDIIINENLEQLYIDIKLTMESL